MAFIKNAKEALVKLLEQKFPAQIKWQNVQKKEGRQLPEDQPIDEPRWQLIQHVQQDDKEGLRITYIAQKYEISRGTVYNYLKQTRPSSKIRRKTKSDQLKLQPFYELIVAYDTERPPMDQIFEKIYLVGYDGSRAVRRHFLEP